MKNRRFVPWLAIGLMITLCGTGLAQEKQVQESAEQMGSNLAQQARNPTASLTMFAIVTNYNASFHNLEGADQLSFVLMPIIPFKTGKLQHIARIVLPYVAAGPDWGALAEYDQGSVQPPNYVPTADLTGLGDTSLFDFLILPAPWKGGRIGVGLSAILPTATDPALGTQKWSVGPALAGLVQSGKLLAGGMILTNFSFAGNSERDNVRSMTLQPFGSYGLGSGWSVELSEMMFNYNFNTSVWGSIPLGMRIGKLLTIGKLPVRFYADAEYNFANSVVAPQWILRFGIVPLL